MEPSPGMDQGQSEIEGDWRVKKTAVLGVLAAAVMVQAAGPVRVDRMLSPVMPTEAELPGYSTWSIESHVTARAD